MRPARSRETSARLSQARAATFVRVHVGWLRGFPIDRKDGVVRWLALDTGETFAIERARISATARAMREARRDFGDSLAKVVGDVDLWQARVSRALDRVKALVHDGAPLESGVDALLVELPAAVARRAREALADRERRVVARALISASCVDPSRLGERLERLSKSPAALSALFEVDPRAALALLDVAVEEGERVEPIFAVLERLIAAPIPGCTKERFVESFPLSIAVGPGEVKLRAPVSRPPMYRALAPFVVALAAWDRRARRRALRLFSRSNPLAVVEAWIAVHATLAELEAVARTRETWMPDAKIVRAMRRLKGEAPPDFDLVEWLSDLRTLVDAFPACVDPLADALEHVPHASTARVRLLRHWVEVLRGSPPAALARAPRYLALFSAHVAVSPERLFPWSTVVHEVDRAVRWYDGHDADLLEELASTTAMKRFFASLCALPATAEASVLTVLARLAELDLAPADAARRAVVMSEPRAPSREAILLSHRLAPDSAEQHAALAHVVDGREGRALLEAWGDLPSLPAGALQRVRRALVDEPGLVSRVADVVAIAKALSLRLPRLGAPAPVELPAWALEYPSAFHPSLARLCACVADAESQAEKVLGKDFPTAAALRAEIAALEGRPEAAARLEALRARLSAPPRAKQGRIDNLVTKLERAIERRLWDEWTRVSFARCAEAIAALLSVPECPAWALETSTLRILATALRLPPAPRELAIRLLRVRTGPPPWDLRDAPENRAVVAAHEARGLDMRPWIEGVPPRTLTLGDETFTLRLEDDPLEIFLMGERFSTCLSLGAGNYFSVFANAADLDKRVAYVRDEHGVAQARCLLALDEDGRVLVFNVYAHRDHRVFHQAIHALALDLARAMNTVCAPQGRVVPRVARAWYDDGPRDVGQQFASLEPGSTFREQLATVAQAELLPLLGRTFEPSLVPRLVPILLELPELNPRPELAWPLVSELLARGEPLSDHVRTRAAFHLERVGDRARARSLLGDVAVVQLERQIQGEPDHFSHWLLKLALDLEPASILRLSKRLARAPRRDGRRHATALYLRARALDALDRPRRALTAWTELEELGWWGQQEVREAIARLTSRLAGREGRA